MAGDDSDRWPAEVGTDDESSDTLISKTPLYTSASLPGGGVAQLAEQWTLKPASTVLEHVTACKHCYERALACSNLHVIAHDVGTEGRHSPTDLHEADAPMSDVGGRERS